MLALKCARCGHQLEIGEAARGQEITCPRCGEHVSSDPAADFSSGATTKKKNENNDETLAPQTAESVEVFAFLSPAQAPDELGWLAHYRVVKLLGQGGMGIVFEAIDTQLQRPVALKVMKPDIARDESARQRFLREARVTASIKNDHIVVIHQVSQHLDVPFLAMEFLQGEPLDQWLDRHGRPSLEETLRIGTEIARGLAAAHELGLIHRDIKPANIWLESTDEGRRMKDEKSSFRVKILDFGLARIARDQAHLTHSGLVLGTPAYMAPEQAEGGEVDARCDLFSLGCVLYELATGAKPFSGTNTMAVLMAVAMKDPLPPTQLNPDLSPALGNLILRLLAKKPQDRPATANDVVAALQAIGDELGVFGQTPTSGIRRSPSTMTASPVAAPKRRPWLMGAAGLASLLAIGLAVWLLISLFGGNSAGFQKSLDDGQAALTKKEYAEAVKAFTEATRLRPNDENARKLLQQAQAALAAAGSDGELILGMSGPLNGPSKELGLEMVIGIRTYLDHINDAGGVHGRKLKLIAMDDGYEPQAALANMKVLLGENKVFAVIGNIGTPTALLTVPYAVENKLLFFGAFTGAKVLRRDPPDRYVFNYRASYEEETAKIVEYLVESRRLKPAQIAVFDQNDGFGDAGFSGVAKVMRARYKIEPKDIVRVRYERNTIQVQGAADGVLKRPDIKAVVMVGTYKPVAEFIRRIKDAGRDMIFTNVSFVGSEALAEGLKELGPEYTAGVIVTQVVPPIDSRSSIVENYHDQCKQYYPTHRPSFISLEGYISTALFVEGLKRAGPNPTTDKMIDALESIRNLDLGTGAPLTFSPSEHQASHKVWATVLDKGGNFQVLDMSE